MTAVRGDKKRAIEAEFLRLKSEGEIVTAKRLAESAGTTERYAALVLAEIRAQFWARNSEAK